MGFKWLLPGPRSSSASVQCPQGHCRGRTDRWTGRQPCSQTRQAFSPRPCAVPKAPGCWDSPPWPYKSIPQEHPSGASLQSIPPEHPSGASLWSIPQEHPAGASLQSIPLEHPAGASLRSIPQEHPAGASRSVAMEMRLRRSASAVPLQYPVAALPSSWLPWEIKEILGLH